MGNPAQTWDEHQHQSSVWLGMKNCKEEAGEQVQEPCRSGMWQRAGAGLMEKSSASAQEQKEQDGSNQGKKLANS